MSERATVDGGGPLRRLRRGGTDLWFLVLGVVVAVLTVVVMIVRGGSDTPQPPPAPAAPPPGAALQQPPPAGPEDETGHSDEPHWPPPPQGVLATPEGEAAYGFILPFLQFSPAVPDNGNRWFESWSAHATPGLEKQAATSFHDQWLWTWQESVKTHMPTVVAAEEVHREPGLVSYRITVNRAIVPVLDAQRPTREDTVTYDVVVTIPPRGNDTGPLVAAAYPPIPGQDRPAPDNIPQD